MKNEKGFTLIEILAVITILGMLVVVAIPAVNKELAKFRTKYYSKLENTIQASGQEYFVDNRFSRPTKILNSKIVKADKLVEKNYMDSYKDYNKHECDNSSDSYSYVVIVKTGDKKYEYQACLRCGDDEYYTDTSKKKYLPAHSLPVCLFRRYFFMMHHRRVGVTTKRGRGAGAPASLSPPFPFRFSPPHPRFP